MWIERIAIWVTNVLAPIVAFLGRMLALAIVFLLIVGITVGTLGQAGRTVYLPFASAFNAGRHQGRCIDLAAGAGVAMSMVLTAAVLDRGFGSWFASAWSTTPLLQTIPEPSQGFDFLLPAAAEGILSPAFAGYLPIVDLALLLLVALTGGVSLLFSTPTWSDEHRSRIAVPILLALGAAIAFALILIILTLIASSFADN